ncbi:ATP-binding protein, partial [Megamonas sp.]
MKLLSLNLQNFRGIKSLNINFEGKSANIYGANGIGKTTIANSISYLLTGQPLTNEKDFSPKTSDTHNLHHIVNGVFELDNGEQISLSKDYYEVYRQKKGELAEKLSGHTTDHY